MSPLCMDDVTDRYFVVCGATSRPCTASEGGVRPFLSTASGECSQFFVLTTIKYSYMSILHISTSSWTLFLLFLITNTMFLNDCFCLYT